MIEITELLPGITLRCFPDDRFKQSCLSIQLVRPLRYEEAALNALIPAVLLRGCKAAPDLRAITLRLDDLYGASVGALVRRVGDVQTTGFYCNFIADRYTLGGEALLQPMVDFVGQLLLEPVTENGVFRKDYVESEKKNLISTLQTQRNDKRVYAGAKLMELMCKNDPFGVPRLGRVKEAKKVTAEALYDHYLQILKESRIDLFYVGPQPGTQVAALLKPLFASLDRTYTPLPAQTPFRGGKGQHRTETMDVTQGKLAMGGTGHGAGVFRACGHHSAVRHAAADEHYGFDRVNYEKDAENSDCCPDPDSFPAGGFPAGTGPAGAGCPGAGGCAAFCCGGLLCLGGVLFFRCGIPVQSLRRDL